MTISQTDQKPNGAAKPKCDCPQIPEVPERWGMRAREFYAGLRGKPVQLVAVDGKIYSGELVGVDQYDVILKTETGPILFAKHALKFVQLAPAASKH